MKKTIGIVIALVVIVGVVVVLKNTNTTTLVANDTTNTVTTDTSTNTTPTVSTPATKPAVTPTKPKVAGYTMSDVSAHATASSCWTAVNGSVYDVTSWINQHPGGARAITGMCGKDASSAYDNQHGGQSRPESELASFKIGVLN